VGLILNEAEGALSGRDWDTAIEKLRKALQLEPNNEEACQRLARCFAVRGLVMQLIDQHFTLMDILESKGDLDLSLEVGRWILKLQPENDQARLRMILIYRRMRNATEALKESLALARVYLELDQGDQAISILQELTQSDPDNAEINMELAQMYIRQGSISEGARLLRKIAVTLLEAGQLEQAAEALRRLKWVTAEDYEVPFMLGNVYRLLQRLDQAETEYRDVLRRNLNHVEALIALGNVCQQKGQFRDAILAFNKLLSIDPQQVVAKEKLGELYEAQGNNAESIKKYLAAAQQHQFSGNAELATTLYQRVIHLEPDNSTATRELSNLGAPAPP
jgi:tetratricopeptide (TPR) repeat protein